MSNYPALPSTVPFVWTTVEQQIAQGTPPAWYKGTTLTPYLMRPSQLQNAWLKPSIAAQLIAPGTPVQIDIRMSAYPVYTRCFVPRDYEWIKIPPFVTGDTIEALCASLMATDPSGTRFPPLYYDTKTPGKRWPGNVPIWRLLVDYWGNAEYRYALAQTKAQDLWTGLTPAFDTAVGDKRLEWVLARIRTVGSVHAVTGGGVTKVVPPKLAPPKMKVGLNHSWAFNQYGSCFGPHAAWIERWFDQLPDNLRHAKERWGVDHVRMFILCNGYSYGTATERSTVTALPVFRKPDLWQFDPPPKLDQKFIDDFTRVLKTFKAAGCKLIPSLLDFGAFAPTAAGGKRDLAVDPVKRKLFLDTVLDPLLDASTSYKDLIYAWEVMNEPSWTTRSFAKPMALDKLGSVFMYMPDRSILSSSELTSFLADALQRIESRGFASTVGHRTYDDMSDFPAGKRRQFHFYAWPVLDAPGYSMCPRIPKYTGGDIDAAENTFVGEIGSGDDGWAWPELHGADATGDTRDKVFERLKAVARKGYPLALVWGNEAWVGPPDVANAVDKWELTNQAILGVMDFNFGLFPDGVP